MTPANLKLTCPQGTTFSRTLTYKVDGVAVNLTGYTARMQVRENYYTNAKLVDLTSGSGITLGGSAGTVSFTLSASATAALPVGTFVYDLEIVSGGGAVTRLVEGKFIVTPEVTK